MPAPDRLILERNERPAGLAPDVDETPLTFEIRNLSIWYGEKRAIDGVNLDIPSNASAGSVDGSGE